MVPAVAAYGMVRPPSTIVWWVVESGSAGSTGAGVGAANALVAAARPRAAAAAAIRRGSASRIVVEPREIGLELRERRRMDVHHVAGLVVAVGDVALQRWRDAEMREQVIRAEE